MDELQRTLPKGPTSYEEDFPMVGNSSSEDADTDEHDGHAPKLITSGRDTSRERHGSSRDAERRHGSSKSKKKRRRRSVSQSSRSDSSDEDRRRKRK
jgi:hypothetical protein